MVNQGDITVWSSVTNRITLSQSDVLGSGGEGAVYSVRSHPDLVAKIYHSNRRTDEVINKLEVMINYPPRTEDDLTGHLFVAWPRYLLYDTASEVIGFLMPKVEKTNSLFEYYNPSLRRRTAPHINYANLCSVAKSLATALDRLHGSGYVVGDINESNAYITENEHATLIDADSFQITDYQTTPPTIYRSLVGKPEYTPPELQGISFAQVDRNIHHDRFALAVVIYQLLMEGTHPFRGIYTGAGEKPQVETCISHGYFLHSENRNVPLRPVPSAVDWNTLHEDIRALFHKCFDDGHYDPQTRPAPRDWIDALDEAIRTLKQCPLNASHWEFDKQASALGNASCAWCERHTNIGIESFPNHPDAHIFIPPAPQQQPPIIPPAPPPTPPLRPPSSTGGSGPTSGAGGGRFQWLLIPLGLLIIIFWGGPGSRRPLWLRLAGAVVALWLGIVLINAVADRINAFEEAIVWPLFAEETLPPAVPIALVVPTETPTPTHTPVLAGAPEIALAHTPAPRNTPLPAAAVPTNTPTLTSTPTHTPEPTATPTPRPTFTPSPTSTATRTPSTTPTATHTPLPTNTPVPTDTPMPMPTDTPVPVPTMAPCAYFGPGTDLNRCDLAGRDLRGFDLTGADLRYANLTGTNLKDAVLTDANFTDATLTEANMENATLKNAIISGASVEGIILTRVDLSSADISGIGSFNKANLQRVVFPPEAHLPGVTFIDTDLSHASAIGANLDFADFTRATLYRTDLTRANLKEATFRQASVNGVKLDGANLQRANLASTDFSEIYFDVNPDFRNADLRNANFYKATLNGVDFSSARMEEAKLDRAEMKGAMFVNVDLNEAEMKDTDMQGARFDGADVSDANFNDSNLTNANFQGADIEDAKFSEADLTGANFSGAMNADKALFGDTTCSDGTESHNCYFEGRLHGIRP